MIVVKSNLKKLVTKAAGAHRPHPPAALLHADISQSRSNFRYNPALPPSQVISLGSSDDDNGDGVYYLGWERGAREAIVAVESRAAAEAL